MSSNTAWLALRLDGPLQSWGFDSQYNIRNTSLMPTKSAIAGMCCAALGFPRGSEDEKEFLTAFAKLKMTAIAIPRRKGSLPLDVRRLEDYHTVQNTRKADGSIKESHITHRYYLTDAGFGVVLEGNRTLLAKISGDSGGPQYSLANPKWGIWLGRKACIPTAPVFVGKFDTKEEALALLIGESPIDSYTRQEEVRVFSDGTDSLSDQAIAFKSERREFAPRRITNFPGRPVTT
ncbi:MAG: type I-E CRISPR-associated protein Cas5/CasD [Rectinemataceae bacterium]|jgi:CRISPR system Cascade subunit CasD